MTAFAASSSFPLHESTVTDGQPISITTAGLLARATCLNPGVTWWNNADGLDPCEQYQQLRGTCDSEYALRPLALDASGKPTDACTAARDDCCCNSVAFTLSMLCLNCQRGHLATSESDSIDAPRPGSYQHYTRICYTPLNGALTTAVQGALRTVDLNLSAYLFTPVPPSGGWHAAQQRASGNASFATATVSPGRPWGPGGVVATRTQLAPRLRVLVGALLGVVIVLASLAALVYALYRRSRDTQAERAYLAQVEREQQVSRRPRRSRRPPAARSDRATVGHGSDETGELNVTPSRLTLVSSFRPPPPIAETSHVKVLPNSK